MSAAPRVAVIGGGMITHDQLLPSLYQMQRDGVVGEISVCALNGRPLRALADSETLRRAFPGQSFRAFPALESDPDTPHPDLYPRSACAHAAAQIAVVAVPDNLHFETILAALEANQHVLTVKPLVLKAAEALRPRAGSILPRPAGGHRLPQTL